MSDKALTRQPPRQQSSIQPQKKPLGDRAERRISELVLAEMFLVQATIESATVLGDRFGDLRRRLAGEAGEKEALGTLLRRTGRDLVEPYAERIEDFRKIFEEDRAA